MKKMILFMAVVVTAAAAQVPPPPYQLKQSAEGKPVTAEWVVKGHTESAVHRALISALLVMGWTVEQQDPEGMAAVSPPDIVPRAALSIELEALSSGTTVTAFWRWLTPAGLASPRAEAKAFYDKLFTKTAAALK